MDLLRKYFPLLTWGAEYSRQTFWRIPSATPVISGFITASGIQIAAGQIAPLIGIKGHGESFVDLVKSMMPHLGEINPYATGIGAASLIFLFWVRSGLKPLLQKFGMSERSAGMMAKLGPIAAIAVTTAAVWGLGLSSRGVKIVGTVPQGLPVPLWRAARSRPRDWRNPRHTAAGS
jgi:MFS superfamily sulfate permease-like transporter